MSGHDGPMRGSCSVRTWGLLALLLVGAATHIAHADSFTDSSLSSDGPLIDPSLKNSRIFPAGSATSGTAVWSPELTVGSRRAACLPASPCAEPSPALDKAAFNAGAPRKVPAN